MEEAAQYGIPKTYWYGGPVFYGTAHAGTEFITQYRNEKFAKVAR